MHSTRFLLWAVACLNFLAGQAIAQSEWIRQFGTVAADSAQAVALYDGGVYVTGSMGSGFGGRVLYLRNYDRFGNFLWARELASVGTASLVSNVAGVATQGGAVFVAGTISQDAFVHRYDASGGLQWARSFNLAAGLGANTLLNGLSVDITGIYVAGFFGNFGGGTGFLRKYDLGGTEMWTRTWDSWVQKVSASPSAVYVTGTAGDTAYVRKYDRDGNFQWVRSAAAGATDGVGVAQIANSVFLAGDIHSGALPGQTSAGGPDLFLQRYDSDGNLLWTRQFGTAGSEGGGGVFADSASVYVTGWTSGTFLGQTNAGGQDGFVQKFDTNGNLLTGAQVGTAADDFSYAAAAEGNSVFLAGATAGSFGGPNAGATDAVLQHLRLSGAGEGLRLVPVTPCRVVDTRGGEGFTGAFGPPSLAADQTRILPIPQGRCSIPSNARAYSLNVTVVPLEPLFYLTVWPGGARPLVSTLNSFHSGVVANAAIIPTGDGGAISVYSTNRTQLIVDINGYFVGESFATSTLGFYTVNPCRLVDTRLVSSAGLGAPGLIAGAVRAFPLLQGSCQLPTWASVMSLNATVVPSNPLAYLTLWPAGRPQPLASTLNAFDGSTVANAAIVEGAVVNAYATDATHLVLDVNGYFGPAGNIGELRFHPVAPCRLADTRSDGTRVPLQASESRDFRVGGVCGIPQGARGYALNVTVVPDGPLGFLTLWPAGTGRPLASTLNSPLGRIVANAAIVPSGSGGFVSVYVTNPTHVVLDVNGYFN